LAVAFEAASSGNGGGNPGPSSLTTSFTVITAAADFLTGQAGWGQGGATRTCDSMTYAAVSMTGLTAAANTAGFVDVGSRIFWLAAPAAGANNMVTTWNTTVNSVQHGFQSFTGAHQTVQGGTVVNGTGTTVVSLVVTSETDGMVVGVATNNAVATSISTGDTESWENENNSEENCATNASRQAGAASVTMDWTTATQACGSAWPIAPAGAAAAAVGHGALLGGVRNVRLGMLN